MERARWEEGGGSDGGRVGRDTIADGFWDWDEYTGGWFGRERVAMVIGASQGGMSRRFVGRVGREVRMSSKRAVSVNIQKFLKAVSSRLSFSSPNHSCRNLFSPKRR